MACFPNEIQAADAVDLDAVLDAAEEGLAGATGHLGGIQGEGALGAGVGLRQEGAGADDLAAGQREVPFIQLQTPAPAVGLLAVGDGAGVGHGGEGLAEPREEDMPDAALQGQPRPPFLPVPGEEIVRLEDLPPSEIDIHTVHINIFTRLPSLF